MVPVHSPVDHQMGSRQSQLVVLVRVKGFETTGSPAGAGSHTVCVYGIGYLGRETAGGSHVKYSARRPGLRSGCLPNNGGAKAVASDREPMAGGSDNHYLLYCSIPRWADRDIRSSKR